MKIKLDENLGRRGLVILKDAGHDVSTVVEQGLLSADDRRILAVCREEGRVLVTLDQEIGNPFRFRPAVFAGIAVLRLPRKPERDDYLNAIRTLASALAIRPITRRLWFVEPGRIREYQQDLDDSEDE